MKRKDIPDQPVDSGEPDDAMRREAMARLGRLSAVTSVSVTTLLLSNKASAQSVLGGGPPPPPDPGGGE